MCHLLCTCLSLEDTGINKAKGIFFTELVVCWGDTNVTLLCFVMNTAAQIPLKDQRVRTLWLPGGRGEGQNSSSQCSCPSKGKRESSRWGAEKMGTGTVERFGKGE